MHRHSYVAYIILPYSYFLTYFPVFRPGKMLGTVIKLSENIHHMLSVIYSLDTWVNFPDGRQLELNFQQPLVKRVYLCHLLC